jgi:hypothetical protein
VAIVLLATFRNIGQGDVRQLEHRLFEIFLERGKFPFHSGDLITERSRLLQEIVGVFAGAFSLRYFLGDCISRSLSLFHGLNESATLDIDLLCAINEGRKRFELATAAHAVAKHLDMLPDHAQIVHVLSGRNA